MLFNHLPQRWARARAEQGNAAAGIGPIASSFMLSLEGKVSGRQRIGQGHRLESVDPSLEGVYLSLEGKGKADKDRREQQPVVLPWRGRITSGA